MIRILTLFIFFIGITPSFAQFNSVTPLSSIVISKNTGEKPQSKIWAHDGTFWTVLPNNSGTYVWRLDGTEWKRDLKISNKTTSKVDCKVVGNITHVLLFHEPNNSNQQKASSELVTLEYASTNKAYTAWPNQRTSLNLGTYVEVATIEVDSHSRMWLAYAVESLSDSKLNDVVVRWSDAPYDNWSDQIIVESQISGDDIAAIIAFPDNKIGVMWSDQVTKRFGFKTHIDGVDPSNWSQNENPASQSALQIGKGMADDHLNMAVASDGTLYCAVKTSYNDNSPERVTEIALLIRKPTGDWDNLYEVSKIGTRPIVILNETEDKLRVIYTDRESGGNIVYKESSLGSINFEDNVQPLNDPDQQSSNGEHTLISGRYNNVTSTKSNFTDEIVIMASSPNNTTGTPVAVSVLASSRIIPLPVELVSFTSRLSADDAVLEWRTASEQDNDYFSVESSTDGRTFTPVGRVSGNGTTQLQKHYSFTDKNISRYRAEGVYYRLRQVDYSGEFEFSPVRYVSAPGLPDVITLKAFPSPFDSYLQVQITSNEELAGTIMLYNAQGRAIQSQETILKRGINTISLTELNLASGIYFLKVTTADQQRVLKLVSE